MAHLTFLEVFLFYFPLQSFLFYLILNSWLQITIQFPTFSEIFKNVFSKSLFLSDIFCLSGFCIHLNNFNYNFAFNPL